MSAPRGVTVFVRRIRSGWTASTFEVEALHPSSATLAARACAARHFGRPERDIELLPQNEADQHVLIASVREPARASDAWPVDFLVFVTVMCLLAGFAVWLGGAL